MAYAVSKWPNDPDPREASFDLHGFDYGQVPPWAWILSTTDATGLCEPFNGEGVIVKPFRILIGRVTFENVDPLPDLVRVEMGHDGFQFPIPPGNETRFYSFVIYQDGAPEFSASYGLQWPEAIVQRAFPIATKVGIGVGTMPNPLIATPAKWNV